MHSVPRCLLIVLMASVGSGCVSNLYLSSHEKASQQQEVVYVSNPEMNTEFEILRASRIYRITNNTNEAARLTLKPLAHGGGCGLGLLTPFYTLGLVPGYLPTRMTFGYEIEQSGKTNSYAHMLPLYERVSLWELFFKPFKSEKRTISKALARSERQGPLKPESFAAGGIIFSPSDDNRREGKTK